MTLVIILFYTCVFVCLSACWRPQGWNVVIVLLSCLFFPTPQWAQYIFKGFVMLTLIKKNYPHMLKSHSRAIFGHIFKWSFRIELRGVGFRGETEKPRRSREIPLLLYSWICWPTNISYQYLRNFTFVHFALSN